MLQRPDKGNKMLKNLPKTLSKTLSIGLGGLLVIGIGVANAATTTASESTAKRTPNVLHEMVPHIVLPETVQYNKTAKNLPGAGYTAPHSPYVATYVAYPSYQVPPTTVFRPIGQAVYPVSPPLLPAPLPKESTAPIDEAVEDKLALQDNAGRDVVLSDKATEPIWLAAGAEEVVPTLPMPGGAVRQTAMFCPDPPKPPAAWAFSSPLFKVASVPAGWGGQTGSIMHHSPRGSVQHLGFQPAIDPSIGAAIPQPTGVPYGQPMMNPMMGYGYGQNAGVQAQILPNGMILLTMPPDHGQCGLIRCRTGNTPRTMLLPPAGNMPQMPPGITPSPAPSQNVAMSGGFGMPYMSVASPQSFMQMAPQMMPQMMQPQIQPMQTVPVTAMTPMGPAIIGYQQVPMMSSQLPQPQQIQMAMATPNPMVLSQMSAAADESVVETAQAQAAGTEPVAENQLALVATPFGYAIQVPADALQPDMAAQRAQMQQALIMQSQAQMPMNPYAGLYATPFGYIAMNPAAGQFGGFGQNMMNVGYAPGMMPGQFMPSQGGGLTVSDVLQIMTFVNSNKSQQRRGRMAERLAERRENRKASAGNDPFTQLMEAWSTPYVTPDTTLRMPARNAYPYGYFGVQASPMGTANYSGYHNLYMGNTAYPGMY